MRFPTGQVRWGIIGCGDVCEVKSGPALQKAGRSTVSAVMRRDGGKAQDFARRHGIGRWYDDAEALIADPDVDAVYVATPPDSHEVYALSAMAAGKPVYCEKPMALTVAACDRMARASEETGLPLITAYYRRSLPRFEKMRELIQTGSIGQPRTVLAQQWRRRTDLPIAGWRLDPSISGGGHFADAYPHVLDWLDHVFGPAHSVQAVTRNQSGACEAEDLVSFLIDQNRVMVTGLCSYAADRTGDRVTVAGSEGTVSMPFFGPAPVRLERGEEVTLIDLPDPPHVHQPFVEQVIACLLDSGPNPCDPATATRSIRTMQMIYGRPG